MTYPQMTQINADENREYSLADCIARPPMEPSQQAYSSAKSASSADNHHTFAACCAASSASSAETLA
jgi:hypothetical protein